MRILRGLFDDVPPETGARPLRAEPTAIET
jgi:hypothetical protein